MSEPIITITIETEGTFTVEDLWPDGDAPDTIDGQTVLDLIREFGETDIYLDWGFPKMEIDAYVFTPIRTKQTKDEQ